MHIVFVTPLYGLYHTGGVAYSCQRITGVLKSSGHRVSVLNIVDGEGHHIDEVDTLQEVSCEKDPSTGVDVYRIPKFYSFTKVKLIEPPRLPVQLNQWYLFLRHWLGKNRADVLVAFYIIPLGYPLSLISQEFSIPLVSAIRGNDIDKTIHDPFMIPILEYILKKSAKVIVPSKEQEMRAKWICPSTPVEVIYNSVDPLLVEKNWKAVASEKKITLGSVGVFKPKKGIELLINAFKIKKRQNDRLLLVGDFAKSNTSKDDVIRDGEDVIITGVISKEEAMCYLEQMDIFVTLSYSDGCPNALLEAMASGRCIVTTPVAAMKDLLVGEESAIFVDGGDTENLVEELSKLIEDRDKIKRLGSNAREAVKKLLPPYEVDRWLNVFEEIT